MVKDSEYSNCRLCPNMCQCDRTNGKKGSCGETDKVRIAWVGLHKGEEPPVSGENGSGMVFFTGCPLHCAYCQNNQISGSRGENYGIEVSIEELSELYLSLEKNGAASLNFVTGTHFIPSIIESLNIARKKGLKLKTVWNSSGYESVDALESIDKYIDLYLLDYKTRNRKVASTFCGKEKYVDCIDSVFDFVKRTKPHTDLDKLEGVLLRHLVFPGEIEATKEVLRIYSQKYKTSFALSLMFQFVCPYDEAIFPKLTDEEYDQLLDYLVELGVEEGFIQERSDEEILWIPDFSKDIPFPESFATPDPLFLALKRKKENRN